ncbi:SusD/RagB family nutrient-binding outer membrane lipoprotein [Rubrolithibacter danxiaensis]|uniref:SusD/RagB family nutrient-binding outer membrane lipoprotein n=1 Tax=Rubrolithibacter danxiaensis TaxID=3390805 RepID=UPI003BF8BE24
MDINADPSVLYTISPEDQFFSAASGMQDDFEWYYDNYRRIMPWMQQLTPTNGNTNNFTRDVSNFNTRYGKVYYGRVGPRLADVTHLIDQLPAEEQAKRAQLRSITDIFMGYYAFYVSDINGSIPYSEAFQARYGGTLTPKYDDQLTLFTTIDQQLKDAVTALKAAPAVAQVSLVNKDLFFNGDASKWIKAANALRLRIALRWMKQDKAKAQSIAAEVAADAAGSMNSIDDSWVFEANYTFAAAGSNWSPIDLRAPKPTVDFMNANSDPRIRLFYTKNVNGDYVGSFTSPDAAKDPANAALYDTPGLLSNIQPRLFSAAENSGTGINFFPLITYADYCFMRAEAAVQGLTADNASTWYTNGVTASIQFYDKKAAAAQVEGYVKVDQSEIDAYLNQAAVKFDAAKALNQIASQAYIDYYKNPNEAWALYKRTGMPNNNTVLQLAVLKSNNVAVEIPRRAPLTLGVPTDMNYENQKAAYEDMAKNPDFGQGPNDAFGRVWWDKK